MKNKRTNNKVSFSTHLKKLAGRMNTELGTLPPEAMEKSAFKGSDFWVQTYGEVICFSFTQQIRIWK
jgi:hypothetical protein